MSPDSEAEKSSDTPAVHGARRSRRRNPRQEKCARVTTGLRPFLRPEGRAPHRQLQPASEFRLRSATILPSFAHKVLLALFLFVSGVAEAAESASALTLTVDEARGELDVRLGERRLLVYSFATNQFKPYVRELWSLQGANVLRDAPADHLHHHGLMYAIRPNGVNFWEERDQPGVEKPIRFLDRQAGRDAQGRPKASFTQLIDWVASSNRWAADSESMALLVERRTITLTVDEPSGEVAVRWQGRFQAGHGADRVKLQGSVYNGLGLRLPQSFDLVAHHFNSESTPGLGTQKSDITPARWSAVTHEIQGRDHTLVLMGQPANAGVTHFFTMLKPFTYLSVTQNLEKAPLEYNRGDPFELDYLLLVYPDKRPAEQIEARHGRWLKERDR